MTSKLFLDTKIQNDFHFGDWIGSLRSLITQKTEQDIISILLFAVIKLRTGMTGGIPEDELTRISKSFEEIFVTLTMLELIIQGLVVPFFYPWQRDISYRASKSLMELSKNRQFRQSISKIGGLK